MFYWVLNIGIAVVAVAVLAGWLRNRRPQSCHEISAAEISDDLAAAEELLEDVLAENDRAGRSRQVSGGL